MRELKKNLKTIALLILVAAMGYGVFCLAYIVDRVTPYVPTEKPMTLEERANAYDSEQTAIQESNLFQ